MISLQIGGCRSIQTCWLCFIFWDHLGVFLKELRVASEESLQRIQTSVNFVSAKSSPAILLIHHIVIDHHSPHDLKSGRGRWGAFVDWLVEGARQCMEGKEEENRNKLAGLLLEGDHLHMNWFLSYFYAAPVLHRRTIVFWDFWRRWNVSLPDLIPPFEGRLCNACRGFANRAAIINNKIFCSIPPTPFSALNIDHGCNNFSENLRYKI